MTLSPIQRIDGTEACITENNRYAATLLRYVFKEHGATRWHYDFRIKINGSLPSWVLPNGLCCCPGESCLAIRVSDHDCRYMISERVIPPGRYGAGPVLLSDEGILILLPGFEDSTERLNSGYLSFRLMSTKVSGIWTLRRRMDHSDGQPNENWDLIKEADESAEGTHAQDTFMTNPRSILSGLTLKELQSGVKKPVKRASMPLPFEE
jgi:bifunctional non-homologous end joining protein LigD